MTRFLSTRRRICHAGRWSTEGASRAIRAVTGSPPD
jgi:hypothetical protein